MASRMMRSKSDLLNWIDNACSNWEGMTDDTRNALYDAINCDGSPLWGQDWSEYLDTLPDNLADLLTDGQQTEMM